MARYLSYTYICLKWSVLKGKIVISIFKQVALENYVLFTRCQFEVSENKLHWPILASFFDKIDKFKWGKCCKPSIACFLLKHLDRLLLDICGHCDKNLAWVLAGLNGLTTGWTTVYTSVSTYWLITLSTQRKDWSSGPCVLNLDPVLFNILVNKTVELRENF